MKGIIYTRVSSDEQVKGTSLESQEEQCKAYCASKDIEVLKVFRDEGESAKSANRPQLLQALEFIRQNKGRVGAFVVAKLDRFARNTEDHFVVKAKLTESGTALFSVSEAIGTSPSEQLMEGILASFASFDNSVRTQRCTDGLSKRIDQGFWPWMPPIGYKSSQTKKRGLKKTEADPHDPETAPLLKMAFKEYLTGLYPQKIIAQKLDTWGLKNIRGRKTNAQLVERMLTNPFYAGILINPWTEKEIQGLHEPMVTPEEFQRIQLIREGRGYNILGRKLREHPDFPLRKTALCGECLGPLTGAWSRGRSKKYPYYRCYNARCVFREKGIAKSDIENHFVDKLQAVALEPEFVNRLENKVTKAWEEYNKTYLSEAKRREKILATLEERKKKIGEMREEGSYTKEEYLERKAKIDIEIIEAKLALGNSHTGEHNLEHLTSFTKQFLQELGTWWKKIPDVVKPRFQKLVFPNNILYMRNVGFGTAELGCIFELSRRFSASNYIDVAGAGFEPAISRL